MTTKTRGPRHPEGLREKIATLAAKPEGFSKSMLKADYPVSTIYNATDWMLKHGEIYRASINSVTVVFFTEQSVAQAYQLKHVRPPKSVTASKGQSFAKGAKTVYKPGYKHSVHLMPPPRTQAVTFGFVHDGMGAM